MVCPVASTSRVISSVDSIGAIPRGVCFPRIGCANCAADLHSDRNLCHHGGQTATSNMPLVADCFGKARICTKILLAPSSKFKHLRSKAECYDRRSLGVHFLLLLHELPLFGTHLHYFFPTSRKQAFDGPSPQFIQRVRVADKASALCWLGGALEMLFVRRAPEQIIIQRHTAPHLDRHWSPYFTPAIRSGPAGHMQCRPIAKWMSGTFHRQPHRCS